ncbi:MAG: hypothetical protein KKA64_04910, partial [Nanoarchaeota archaeon]|nr:hypothetical protein [Nanoarchaeota archaeon]
ACVFEKEFEKTCKMTTQKECQDMGALLTSNSSSAVKFYEGFLCSAESLGTNCGPSEKTTCVEGKDEVYFLDTCGNLANIYDASKIKDKNYWREIIQKSDSCGAGSGNENSATCGSCDYFLGSTCKKYKAGEDKVKPNYGDNICRDLSCKWKGKTYSHGETWCEGEGTSKITPESVPENGAEGAILDNSKADNLPGTRYFRLVCYDGEVTLEPCADFRAEICIQDELNGFKTAACRVNRWQDCLAQDDELDCGNTDKRDCKWIALKGSIAGIDAEEACIPKYAPGLDFYTIVGSTAAVAPQPFQGTQAQQSVQANAPAQMVQGQGSAESICGTANVQCIVEYEKGLTGGEKCKKNCECETDVWKNKMNNLCSFLGDCGVGMNYKGIAGSLGGVEVKIEKGVDEGE